MKKYIILILLLVSACYPRWNSTPANVEPVITEPQIVEPTVAKPAILEPINVSHKKPRHVKPTKKPRKISLKNGVVLVPTSFDKLQGWEKDNHKEALKVFNKSCKKNKKYKGLCNKKPRNAKAFLEKNFTPYLVTDRNGKAAGTFTGYYEIGLKGSYKKHGKYQYPLYAPPPKKYLKLTRKQVDNGGLNGLKKEILWLDNPVDVFSLHIQGSGLVKLDDGTYTRIGYAGRNAHKYASIGTWMMKNKYVPKNGMSATGIRNWLRNHPDKMHYIMQKNPSYIYFRETGAKGAIGAAGVALTGERSMAVDRRYVELGSMLWLDTKLPDYKKYQRLFVAQDTGSAIKGKTRGDIFFGLGDRATYLASHMKQKGRYYLLVRN